MKKITNVGETNLNILWDYKHEYDVGMSYSWTVSGSKILLIKCFPYDHQAFVLSDHRGRAGWDCEHSLLCSQISGDRTETLGTQPHSGIQQFTHTVSTEFKDWLSNSFVTCVWLRGKRCFPTFKLLHVIIMLNTKTTGGRGPQTLSFCKSTNTTL